MAEELIGIIGGSGLGDSLSEMIIDGTAHDLDTPFGKPSCPIVVGKFADKRIAFLNRHGEGHIFTPSTVPYAANIFAMKKLGVKTIVSTCAVGSLREEIQPGNLVIVDQFIDKTVRRQTSFFDELGAVHCEMAHPVCSRLSGKLLKASEKINIKTHPSATYVCMEGPGFSTRAESLMHRIWGGDLIGMTAMPEAKLAREAQICYAQVSLVSDYDCWREHEKNKDKHTLLKEIIGNLQAATENCLTLIKEFLSNAEGAVCDDCQCRNSLELAVWTANDKMDPARKQKLAVLFD